MTTHGLPGQNDLGLESIIKRLPGMIARANQDGRPVVVDLPANLSPAHQRLMATLGVLVRFKPVEPRRARNGSKSDRCAARRSVRDAITDHGLSDELALRAHDWLVDV